MRSWVKSFIPDIGNENPEFRHIWVAEQLATVPTGSSILDVGAGERRYRDQCSHLEYYSQDFGSYDGKGDGTGLQTGAWDQSEIDYLSDITDMPVESETFDAALCTEVLEHVPDPISALREISRILRPGGTLILTAPQASLTHFAPYYFYGGFSRYFFERYLAEMGYAMEFVHPNGTYFEYLAQELRKLSTRSYPWTDRKLGLLGNIGRFLTLRALAKLNLGDRGSGELLCFGYLVRARKV
jgi:SAM-dependent methyltransferase